MTVEELEVRLVFTASGTVHPLVHIMTPPPGFGPPYTPKEVRHAYGFDLVKFTNNGTTINGTGGGQWIAIVDAFSDPNIVADLTAFDTQFKLPAPPHLKIVNQTGGTTLPGTSVSWGLEESLDVEWAHALAPNANIMLVEANSATDTDLNKAVRFAAKLNAVTAVSMSWGGNEFSGETAFDASYTTPAVHTNGGVTFLAATGDSGSPGGYPAYSPNVVAVGGTSLTLNSSTGAYSVETAWSGSGGGKSAFEPEPTDQKGVQSSNKRSIPDVSFLADPNTGVQVFDSFGGFGWVEVGGTSLSTPSWAAIIAVTNQGRVLGGAKPLANAQADLYALPRSDFHDITSGSNGGFSAKAGYDFVTGIGTPKVSLVVAGLLGASATVVTSGQTTGSGTAGGGAGSAVVMAGSQASALPMPVTATSALTLPNSSGHGFTTVSAAPQVQLPPIVQTASHPMTDSGTAQETETVDLDVAPIAPAGSSREMRIDDGQDGPRASVEQASPSAARDLLFAEHAVALAAGPDNMVAPENEPEVSVAGSPMIFGGALALLGMSSDRKRQTPPAIKG
jgi:subtilase family serine protease